MLSLAMPGERKEGADTERTPKRTGCCKKRQWERTWTGELKLTAVGRRDVKREVVISVTRKPKNLVAPQDGVGKSQTPGLANREW